MGFTARASHLALQPTHSNLGPFEWLKALFVQCNIKTSKESCIEC